MNIPSKFVEQVHNMVKKKCRLHDDYYYYFDTTGEMKVNQHIQNLVT